MKKTTYAVLGTVLVIVAALARLHWGGSVETAGMVLLGLGLLLASADAPTKAQVRR